MNTEAVTPTPRRHTLMLWLFASVVACALCLHGISAALIDGVFIPADQDKKLALISDANNLIGITVAPFEVMDPPNDGQIAASLSTTAGKLRTAATGNSQPEQNARRLAAALEAVVKAGPEARARAGEAQQQVPLHRHLLQDDSRPNQREKNEVVFGSASTAGMVGCTP